MQNIIPTIRGAAHDIRGFLANASLATERLFEHEDQQVTLRAKTITNALNQIIEICNTNLTDPCVAGQKTEHDSDDVRMVIEQIAFLISPSADCELSFPMIDVEVEKDIRLNCNRAYLFRAIYNLAINAANAIRTHSGTGIKLRAEPNGAFINIYVDDDGPGLPDHILSHLYPDISNTKGTSIFTNYGLMTTIAMINEMGGRLHLIHTSELGTKFCIMLPTT